MWNSTRAGGGDLFTAFGAAPLRADLLPGESWRSEGRALGAGQRRTLPGFTGVRHPGRLIANQAAVLRNYVATLNAVRGGAIATPAADWLLDNHHVMEEAFRHVRRDLAPRFYDSLPQTMVAGKPVPEALTLAWAYVALTNSEVMLPTLTELVEGWQEARTLTIGEIWAIPAMLRWVLLENLRRITDRVAEAQRQRRAANALADRMLADDAPPVETLRSGLNGGAAAPPFVAQLLYRLRDGSERAEKALDWIERQLAARGSDAETMLAEEHARQSASNVTMGNIIRSLRRIDDINWTEWFETVSQVDAILRDGSDFARLDRATRNTYRDTIERVARRAPITEIEVARRAVALAQGGDTGALLVGRRLGAFEAGLGYRPRPAERLRAAWRRMGWFGVFSPAVAITVAIALAMAMLVPAALPGWQAWLLFILALLSASEAAMGLVRLAATRLLPTARLPGYDFRKGVPEEARTLVVIPCLLTDLDTVDDLVRQLELHYLANPRGAVDFALLSDWADSATEETPQDRALLDHAHRAIEALAARYSADGRRFYLLHRRRLWNPVDQVWMGWERKRGKLAELNALILGEGETGFVGGTGPRPPEGIRFVLTLDADTRLERDSVAALAGKLMHPVNRPVADPESGVVTAGHAILQPRVTASLTTGAEASLFQHIFSAGRGMDPYVFTVSDLYQDLLDRGSFTGKGIYDVAAFQRAMSDRIPENRVLSHDLLEGTLARAALVSDVQFIEDFPTRFDIEAARQHRWARGDWQLLPFILDPANGIPALGRLKMVDNLRRSLVPPAWVGASVTGWLTLPAMLAWGWQLALLATLFFMPIMNFQAGVVPRQKGVSALRHLGRVAGDLRDHLLEISLRLILMAQLAALMTDAILRSLWRLLVSKRHMLEWKTAAQIGADDSGEALRNMWASPAIGVLALEAVALGRPANLPLAVLFAVPWIVAPWVARRVSRSMETEDRLDPDAADAAELRRVARTSWRFFETFVTAASNHLPPDNHQDQPVPKLAERTSPTNIGLYLLSVLSAHDLGWISLPAAVGRIERTLQTLGRMERFHGHFFNWYATADLKVLEPRYVSSVDSGNLAGHLIALASALRAWGEHPSVYRHGTLDGIGDTLAVLDYCLGRVADDRRALRPLRRRLEELIEGFRRSHADYSAEPQLAPVRAINLVVIAADIRRLAQDLHSEAGSEATAELIWWAGALCTTCEEMIGETGGDPAGQASFGERVLALSETARRLAFEMDFALLMQPEKRLLSIGYRVDSGELDDSSYDLLASEARLASLFGIAKGDLPREHWLRLGRPMTAIGMQGVLLSWSGSMFEYLMPPLVMRERLGGVLNASNAMAIREQIRFGRRRGLPWGVSESAFNARDREMNYQYHAFGVPSLGLRRTLVDEAVVAPYATLLACQIRPREAVRNLRRLDALGAFGRYGYFDAIDFSADRLPEGETHAVVRTVMAHHHGMSIVAVANAVLDGIHRDRFHFDPVIQAAELLLQEKAPREIVAVTRQPATDGRGAGAEPAEGAITLSDDPAGDRGTLALLSNGRMSALLGAGGAGQLRVDDLAVTRWRRDAIGDQGGIHLFLRDTDSGDWWSASATPRRSEGETARAQFSDHMAGFTKRANGIDSRMDVIVASEANAEGRRLTIRNGGDRSRSIEVTSYGEIVLDREAADLAHPAFAKMFVKTTICDGGNTITAVRNPRADGERVLHLAHLLAGVGERRTIEAETDRRAFIGRGRDLGTAAAFDPGARLSNSEGFTLDPVFALRRRLKLLPGKEVKLVFWTIVADSAEALAASIGHYQHSETFDHEERLAWTHSQVQLRHYEITLEEAALFRRLAAALVWPDPRLAIQDEEARRALGPQSDLWPMGISGDRPIFVLRIDDEVDLPIIRKALQMMEYFHARRLAVDLVVLNEKPSSYVQDLQTAIQSICDMATRAGHADPDRCLVIPVRRDQIPDASHATLLAAARVVLHTRNGSLSEQVSRLGAQEAAAEQAADIPARAPDLPPLPAPGRRTPDFPDEELFGWNGYGGFATASREYVVRLRPGQRTPQPWINVIARGDFGFHVSAGGAAFGWAANSRDYQITPWSNDPVANPPGEAILIRDAGSGRIATPFAALSEDRHAIHEARHGMGVSRFRGWSDWIETEAAMLLLADGPARLTRLRLKNRSNRVLSLEVAAYAELVLGNNRGRTAPMIRASVADGAIMARNPFATEYTGRVTALAADRAPDATCLSRLAFLGRNGSLKRPAALAGPWPEATGTDADPCAALLFRLTLAPGAEESLTLILADAPEAEIGAVLARARRPDAVEAGLAAAAAEWDEFLGTLQVETPDPRLDLMVNTWLPYQALACRIRARSAFYQASGAFGFRDQLQDTSAMILHDPDLARAQILNAGGRQFPEGDVQHWWLPQTGAGVRTTISDDVVWLAHATARYVAQTADAAILDTDLAFLNGPRLEPGRHDAFFAPEVAEQTATLYEHCALALDLAIRRTGGDGLPLMLGGDWNDGMNRVGAEGRGQSVWLGWFLLATLDMFTPLAEKRGDTARVGAWTAHRAALLAALEAAWDGGWYRRASYDDGTPLGAAGSDECRIDSIAQSWAAIAGAGDGERAGRALDAVLEHLANRDAGILRLFTPPFENTPRDPGYIKSYPPGVRENGGQYTHAAAWVIHALGRTGRGTDALAMFDMISPISHSRDRAAADRYRVEPYVAAADIYSGGEKDGRGGWTWYTGSAGWLYRAAVEGILGLRLEDGRRLRIDPALPDGWDGFSATLRRDGRQRQIRVSRDGSRLSIHVDGVTQPGDVVDLDRPEK